jgi:16S rRNA (guanine1207-N2)-methyltransferase/23S rRNA (guanine1835-N2)-methyltransferase
MKTNLEVQEQNYQLYRYPPKLQHVSLQAWDSADELIINYLYENPIQLSKPRIILNDEFGVLACVLHKNNFAWYSDSKVAELGLKKNWSLNCQEKITFNIESQLPAIKHGAEIAILKLPKSNNFLIEELITLRNVLPQGALVITGGKANNISKATLALFEKHLGSTHTSLATKKSRLIFTTVNKSLSTKSKFPNAWPTSPSNLQVHNLSNAFSANQLDIGARFLLENIPDCKNKTIIDLGCGNGVLSAHAMLSKPKELYCIDESRMAIDSAKLTIEHNFPIQKTSVHYLHSNCLEQLHNTKANLILCNPPFHQNNTITDHIAWQMFNDAKETLHLGGELRVVGNRHLGYHQKLKRLFGDCKMIASNQKFVILSCLKK